MLCEYGNCHNEDCTVVLSFDIKKGATGSGERKRFCSLVHAALWALGWARTSYTNAATGRKEPLSEIPK